jgi:hypothetical protein
MTDVSPYRSGNFAPVDEVTALALDAQDFTGEPVATTTYRNGCHSGFAAAGSRTPERATDK